MQPGAKPAKCESGATPGPRRVLAGLLLVLTSVLAPGLATSKNSASPGAYCPIPEPGEKPACQTPARQTYSDFFAAVDSGELDDPTAQRLEDDLFLGENDERAYLALSSLSYGYYRLAQTLAPGPAEDVSVKNRLERWNQLLLRAYGGSERAPRFRAALREAVEDLHRRTPPVGRTCESDDCGGAEGLVRQLARIDENAGLRSPLTRLLRRILGGEARDSRAPAPARDSTP